MKPIESPLRILDFAITEFAFDLASGPQNETSKLVVDYFDDYELDIDFDMYKGEILRVLIRVDVNKTKQLPGYSLTAAATCLFQFNKDKNITDEQRNGIEGFSTIYIALNSLRGLISSFTANAPFGRYILPSVDLNNLIEQKSNSFKKESIENIKKK